MNRFWFGLALLWLASSTLGAAWLLANGGSRGKNRGLPFWALYWQLSLVLLGILYGTARDGSALKIVGSGVVGGAVGGVFGLLFSAAFALFAFGIDRPLRRRFPPDRGYVRLPIGAAVWLLFGASMVGVLMPCNHAIQRFSSVSRDDPAEGVLTVDWRFWVESIASHTESLAVTGAVVGGAIGAVAGFLTWMPPARPVNARGHNPFAEENREA